jgi:hypothetical protein
VLGAMRYMLLTFREHAGRPARSRRPWRRRFEGTSLGVGRGRLDAILAAVIGRAAVARMAVLVWGIEPSMIQTAQLGRL